MPRFLERAFRKQRRARESLIAYALCLLIMAAAGSSEAQTTDILTHHYDVQRTGWNSQEAALSPASLLSGSFGLLATVQLDDHVDAQPLVVTNQPISVAGGTFTVVYVATESNTIYAIDASTGNVLLSTNLGAPVPQSAFGGCNANVANIGINATPVIDRSAGLLYVIAYTFDGQVATHTLHALDLSTLTDTLPPVVVTASQTLGDGTVYNFDSKTSRHRAALLEANGNIYAAFASFCDFFSDRSRGWVLGWNASTLQPLPSNRLTNTLAASPSTYFLSSVWMSGSGAAVSADGSLLFTTGNSDPVSSYDSVQNLSESLVKITGDLSSVLDFFTPNEVATLEASDLDFGSGGVLAVPPRPGAILNLAVAAGKSGNMYLLDQGNLGGITPGGPDNVLGTFFVGFCWCAPSYFTGADGVGRIVSSGGSSVMVWQVLTSPTPTLNQESATAPLNTGQDPGFFTSVSSNGTQDGTALIWAVSRPVDTTGAISLYAFDARDGSLVFSGPAGTWLSQGDADVVPVVANGQVYVASTQQLAIFGLASPGTPTVAAAAPSAPTAAAALPAALSTPPSAAGSSASTAATTVASTASWAAPAASKEARVSASVRNRDGRLSGTILEVNGPALTLKTRTGRRAQINVAQAQKSRQSVVLFAGEMITASGTYDPQGVLKARTIVRAKDSSALWPPDR